MSAFEFTALPRMGAIPMPMLTPTLTEGCARSRAGERIMAGLQRQAGNIAPLSLTPCQHGQNKSQAGGKYRHDPEHGPMNLLPSQDFNAIERGGDEKRARWIL